MMVVILVMMVIMVIMMLMTMVHDWPRNPTSPASSNVALNVALGGKHCGLARLNACSLFIRSLRSHFGLFPLYVSGSARLFRG